MKCPKGLPSLDGIDIADTIAILDAIDVVAIFWVE